jgi:flagellar motor switch protein FliM
VHEKWPTLNLIDDRIATLFGRELSRALAESVEASVVDGGVRKFRDVADGLESPGCLNYLEFEALGGYGLLAIEQSLLFGLLERLFGAADSPTPEQPRAGKARFSAIEERVIRRLVLLFGRSLEEAWRPIVPLTVRHSRVETKPVNVAIARPGEWVVTTEIEVRIGACSGSVLFALPHTLLESYRERLATGQYEEKAQADNGWPRAIRAMLEEVPVDIVAELGRADLTLGRLLDLAVGDVVRLDQASSSPITVSVDEVPKYRGEITVEHGNLAVDLTCIHERANHHGTHDT